MHGYGSVYTQQFPRARRARSTLWKSCLLAYAIAECGTSAAAPIVTADLADLSLEQLTRIEVTSVSRRPESLLDAPASIYVITNEDIRRSGVTTLPEALRLAPNLQVARTTTSAYAISARGFNNAIGNKLLVLIDGRTVYTPLFSGVFWEQQDVMLEDIERIEVISGPGGTLWGVNAVNGVINVITRAAKDTQGMLVTAGAGNRAEGAGFRYGGKLGEQGHVRVYAKSAELQNSFRANDSSMPDGWQAGQVGFRADWQTGRGGFTLQGDAYRGHGEHGGFIGPFELSPIRVAGANVLARWTQKLSDISEVKLQVYVDRTRRDDPLFYRPDSSIFDVDFQHALSFDRHKIVWGTGYRRGTDDVQPGSVFTSFVPPSSQLSWTNVFVQDEFALTRTVDVTPGIRFEHNSYTGMEYLPSLRVAWKPRPEHAVRTPSRFDRDVRFPANPPFFVRGGANFRSEVANVFEVGYRSTPSRVLTYSVTAFRHNWQHLRSGGEPLGALGNTIDGFVNGSKPGLPCSRRASGG
jgi:iron complex outermembrane receptor protein